MFPASCSAKGLIGLKALALRCEYQCDLLCEGFAICQISIKDEDERMDDHRFTDERVVYFINGQCFVALLDIEVTHSS